MLHADLFAYLVQQFRLCAGRCVCGFHSGVFLGGERWQTKAWRHNTRIIHLHGAKQDACRGIGIDATPQGVFVLSIRVYFPPPVFCKQRVAGTNAVLGTLEAQKKTPAPGFAPESVFAVSIRVCFPAEAVDRQGIWGVESALATRMAQKKMPVRVSNTKLSQNRYHYLDIGSQQRSVDGKGKIWYLAKHPSRGA